MSAIASQLESLVGLSSICPWETLEPSLKAQISQAIAPNTQIACVVYPKTQAELAEVMTYAHQDRISVLPCGSGSKLHWGGLAEGISLVVSTARMNKLVEHAAGDLTVTAEAGLRFAGLQATLATQGQFLAIDPADAAIATLGGIVATADTGSLRQRYGGIRDMLIGLSFVRADGQVAKAGGRVVKNVAGYDLMKLFTGSWGTLGIISQVTFRIYPLPEASQTVVLTGPETLAQPLERIAQATQTLLTSALNAIAVDLISPQLVAHLSLGQGMGLIACFRGLGVSVREQANRLMQVGDALDLKTTCLSSQDEQRLWNALQRLETASTPHQPITCKIGVLPSEAVTALDRLSAAMPSPQSGLIHAASGLGMLRFEGNSITRDRLLKLRYLCQAAGGFLTVLEAPIALKQQLDLWGYPGNALPLMQKLKQQFDPESLLSPHRFVGEI